MNIVKLNILYFIFYISIGDLFVICVYFFRKLLCCCKFWL